MKRHGEVAFEDLFSGDASSLGAAAYVVAPINFLLRNAFEDIELEGLTLDIDASEQPRTATLERVWVDGTRIRPGTTVDLKILLRTYRGERPGGCKHRRALLALRQCGKLPDPRGASYRAGHSDQIPF